MRRPQPRPWSALQLLLVPLVASLACRALAPDGLVGPGAATPTAANGQATNEASSSATPGQSSTPTSGETPAPLEFGPGPFNLIEPALGLTELSSYTATLRVAFDGTEEGQPSQWSTVLTLRLATEPPALEVTFQRPDEAAPRLYLAELAGATYERREDGACTAGLADPAERLADTYQPAGSLSPVVGAEAAGTETVNGIVAKHFTFDERALGFAGFSTSTGELWVAAEQGYLVRYRLSTEAGPEYFGREAEGTMTWEYELSGVNEPVEVVVPKDCPAGLISIPMPPDATNVRSLPGFLSFDTALAPLEAGAFYRDSLQGQGWELARTAMITDTAALLDFSQGGSHLTVSVTRAQAGSAVHIVQTR